jgi:hypothetical protein
MDFQKVYRKNLNQDHHFQLPKTLGCSLKSFKEPCHFVCTIFSVMHLPFEFPIDATFLETKLKSYEMPSLFMGDATWNSKFNNLNNKQNFPT